MRKRFPSNAIYGFLNILTKLINDYNPDYILAAFDLKAPTFRHKLYSEYKATRKGMPEELAIQLPIMKDILSYMNIPAITIMRIKMTINTIYFFFISLPSG